MTLLARLPARLRGDSAFSIADQILVSGANFGVGIVAARVLGVADFGLFALVLMIANLAGVATGHMLSLPMMTLAGARPKRSDAYFATILRLGIVLCLVSGVVVAAVIAGVDVLRGDPVDPWMLAGVVFLSFGQNMQILVRSVLFVRRDYRAALTLDVARIVLLLVAAVAGALTFGTHFGATPVFVLIGASALAVTLPQLVRAMGAKVRAGLARQVLARHWPLSKWMLLMMLVSLGQEQALWLIVGVKMGDEALGALRAGQYILGTTHFLVLAFENFIPRNAAEELRRGGEARLRSYLTRQALVFGGASVLLILLMAVFAQPLLGLFFGPSYEAYAGITRILALSYAATVLRTIWSYHLRSIERTSAIFWAFAVSSATAMILIYPAIDRYGVEGAAWTICIAQIVCLCLVVLAVARHRPRHDTAPISALGSIAR